MIDILQLTWQTFGLPFMAVLIFFVVYRLVYGPEEE